MNIERFVVKNKEELLGIYGSIYNGRIMEKFIDPSIKEEVFVRDCCFLSIICKRYKEGKVDFPIDVSEAKTIDYTISGELYAITQCEEAVRDGFLNRSGLRYTPVKGLIPPRIKLGKKYIIPEA